MKRRAEVEKNPAILIALIKYVDMLDNVFCEDGNTQGKLAAVLASFIAAEEEGLIKINDKYELKR